VASAEEAAKLVQQQQPVLVEVRFGEEL